MISFPSTPQFQYSHDLFYIAPFYHLAFPNLDHLIATDLDIEFRYLKDFFQLYLFYRTHVHMGSDHWVPPSVTPYKSFLKPCEDLVKTVNVVNVVKI